VEMFHPIIRTMKWKTVNFADTRNLSFVIYLNYLFHTRSAVQYLNDKLRKTLNHSWVLIPQDMAV
jgi:hypothetical protein